MGITFCINNKANSRLLMRPVEYCFSLHNRCRSSYKQGKAVAWPLGFNVGEHLVCSIVGWSRCSLNNSTLLRNVRYGKTVYEITQASISRAKTFNSELRHFDTIFIQFVRCKDPAARFRGENIARNAILLIARKTQTTENDILMKSAI